MFILIIVEWLRYTSNNFNNKACHPVPTTNSGIHVDLCLQGHHIAICACVAAKRSGISAKFYCFFIIFLCFIRHLVTICPLLTDVVSSVLEGLVCLLGIAQACMETSHNCFLSPSLKFRYYNLVRLYVTKNRDTNWKTYKWSSIHARYTDIIMVHPRKTNIILYIWLNNQSKI